jgi:hypothetical protein
MTLVVTRQEASTPVERTPMAPAGASDPRAQEWRQTDRQPDCGCARQASKAPPRVSPRRRWRSGSAGPGAAGWGGAGEAAAAVHKMPHQRTTGYDAAARLAVSVSVAPHLVRRVAQRLDGAGQLVVEACGAAGGAARQPTPLRLAPHLTLPASHITLRTSHVTPVKALSSTGVRQ